MKQSILTVLIVSAVLIGLTGAAQASETQLSATYLGWDKNLNTAKMQVDITAPSPGKLVYVENYYSVDSFGKPKFYSAARHEVTGNTLSFVLQRPKDGRGTRYSLVEKMLVTNGKITSSTWVDLRKSWS